MDDQDLPQHEDDCDSLLRQLAEFEEALRDAFLPISVGEMVGCNKFQQLEAYFREEKNRHRVNYCINSPQAGMTCLEHAVSAGNWKMACFLIVALDADPEKNKFDGVLETMASAYGVGPPLEYEEFNGKPIPGYKGLKVLANVYLKEKGENLNEIMTAFLSLMEWTTTSEPPPPQAEGDENMSDVWNEIITAIANVRRVDPLKITAMIAELKETVILTQLVFQKKKYSNSLEQTVADDVLRHVVQNYVWNSFACKTVKRCLEPREELDIV
jgi:hypothetical protein